MDVVGQKLAWSNLQVGFCVAAERKIRRVVSGRALVSACQEECTKSRPFSRHTCGVFRAMLQLKDQSRCKGLTVAPDERDILFLTAVLGEATKSAAVKS